MGIATVAMAVALLDVLWPVMAVALFALRTVYTNLNICRIHIIVCVITEKITFKNLKQLVDFTVRISCFPL